MTIQFMDLEATYFNVGLQSLLIVNVPIVIDATRNTSNTTIVSRVTYAHAYILICYISLVV